MGALISTCCLSTCSPVSILTSSHGRRVVVVWREYSKINQQFFSDGASVWSSHITTRSGSARYIGARWGSRSRRVSARRPSIRPCSSIATPQVARRCRPDVPTRAEETRAEDRAPHTHPSPPPHLRLRRLALHAAAAARVAPDSHPDGGTSIPRRPRDESDADRPVHRRTNRRSHPRPYVSTAPSQTRPRVPTSPPPTTH